MITGIPGKTPFNISISLRVDPLQTGRAVEAGSLHVRRQQVDDNLGGVIENALKRKLPKLINTTADRRILLLERQHMNLYPDRMLDEINKRRPTFPDLARVDEIWIIEAMFYGTAFGGNYVRFDHHQNGKKVESLTFNDGKLRMMS